MSEDYKVEAEIILKGMAQTARDSKRAAVEVEKLGRAIVKAQRETQQFAARRDADRLRNFGRQIRLVAQEMLKQERAAKRAEAASRRAAAEAARAQREAARMMSSVSAGFSRVGGAMTGVSRTIGRIALGLGALGVGAAYIGLRIARTMVTDIGMRALQANSQVEDMITSLASVSQYVEGVDFATAQEGARGVYRELERLAAASPGTAADLATVYNAIYGPMRQAGVSLQNLAFLSQHAVAVGSALGVDNQQIARDMAMMATGAAGQDVKTFRLLRSMGLLTETTQQWNQMAQRDPSQAASRMVAMFAQLGGPAAEAYGRTWTGISSSFQDLMNQFGRLLTAPAFEVLKERLAAVVAYLQRHQTWIRSTLTTMGNRIGVVFRGIIDRGQRAYEYILTHFDAIHARFDRLVSRVRELLPLVARVAKGVGLAAVGLRAGGAGLSTMGAVGGGVSTLATMGIGGGGAAAAGATGLSGATMASIGTIAAALAPVAAVFLALGGAAVAVWRAFSNFGAELRILLQPLWQDLQLIGSDLMGYFSGLWTMLDPIWSFIGTVIIGVGIAAFRTLFLVVRLVTSFLRVLGAVFQWVGTNVIRPVFDRLSSTVINVIYVFNILATAIRSLFDWLREHVPGMRGLLPATSAPTARAARVDPFAGLGSRGGEFGRGAYRETPYQVPGDRPSTNIDMRGSRIEVRQEFRESDPDRIIVRMRDELAREAVSRISSGFVPALTR